MSKWSPGTPVNNAATTGSSGSYLASMSSGAQPVEPSYSEASYSAAPAPAAATPVSGGGGSAFDGSKKSYSMSKWSPGTPVNNAATTGSSGSYLASMSSGAQPVEPSYSEASYSAAPAPAAATPVSGGGGSAFDGSKKSYSMSKWSPGTPVNNAATTGSSGSYLASMSSGAQPVEPSYSEASYSAAPAPAAATPVSGGGGSAFDGSKKSYSMSKWSPGTPVNNAATTGSSGSYLASMSSGAQPVEPSYSEASYSAAPAPAAATPVSGGGGSAFDGSKKSYSMSKWSPGTPVNNAATTGSSGSYLASMSSGAQPVEPSYSEASYSAAPAPAAATPVSGGGGSAFDGSKKSYSMSKWSPGTPVNNAATTGSSGSYLASMSSGAQPVAPSYSEPAEASYSAPAPAPAAAFSGGGGTSGFGGSSKSYSMSKWSPGSPVNNAATTGSSGSYLASMSSGAQPVAPSYSEPAEASYSAPAPAPATAFSGGGGTSGFGGSSKSYSMSKWSPGSPVNNAATTGSSGSYLASMSSGAQPVAPSYSEPAEASYSAPAPAPAAAFSGGGGTSGFGGGSKSYSMSKWSPGSPVNNAATTGSSGSYLASMSSGAPPVAPSYSEPAEASYSAPAPAPATAFSGGGGTSGFGGGSSKSYSMSKWSPGSPVNNAATTGSSGSYLASMSSGAQPVAPSYSEPAEASYSAPAPAPAAAFSGGGGTSGFGGSSKSYSMSKWSPGSPVNNAATTGSSGSYLASMSSGAPPVAPSYSEPAEASYSAPAPAPATAFSGGGGTSGFGGGSSKSYSMSKWSPGSPVNNAATTGSSGSYLASMSSGAQPVAPSYSEPAEASYSAPAPAPATAFSGGGGTSGFGGGSSKSYSMSKWSPGSPVNNAATTGSSGSYLASMSSGAPPVAPSYSEPAEASYSAPAPAPATAFSGGGGTSGFGGGSSKSYSMSKWSPGSPVNNAATTGSSGSYLASMSSGAQPVAPSYSEPAEASYSAPAPAPAAAFSGGGGTSGFGGGGSKSYSMSKWSPGSPVNNAATTGSSGSYLSSMSSGAQPVAPSYSEPSEAINGESVSSFSPGGIGGSGVKKSYSVSKWSPGSVVNGSGAANGSSDSYLSNMVNGAQPIVPTPSAPPISPASSLPMQNEAAPGSKKSYSMSKWSPGNPVSQGMLVS